MQKITFCIAFAVGGVYLKRQIQKGALLAIALFSVLIGTAICKRNEALAGYVVYVCIILFALTTTAYAVVLRMLDSRRPLSEKPEEKETKQNRSSNFSLFPTAEEIEAAQSVEIAGDEEEPRESDDNS